MKKLVSLGRGGVGKTCFIAGLAAVLREEEGPLLLIDADPDQNLAEMIGADVEGAGVKTVSDILFDIKAGSVDERIEKAPLAEKVDYLLSRHGLYEGEGFDLIALGTKWTEGCYCQPNNILKALMERLERSYRRVLIDCPGGLEHLNRRITSSVDDIFAIVNPSKKALDNARRARRVIGEIGIRYRTFNLVGSFDLPEESRGVLAAEPECRYAGSLAFDPEVARLAAEGRSLLTLPKNSPFLESLRGIMARAASGG